MKRTIPPIRLSVSARPPEDPVRGPGTYLIAVEFGDETEQLLPLVKDAIALIGPRPEREGECWESVLRAITDVRGAMTVAAVKPTPRQEKKMLDDLLRTLQKAATQLAELPGPLTYIDHRDVRTLYLALPGVIEQFTKTVQQYKPPRAPWEGTEGRAAAAKGAYELITTFSQARPTKTNGGPFYCLATIIFDAACGSEGADLRRHCDALLDQSR